MNYVCPYCGTERASANGTGSDVNCCGEVGHVVTNYDPTPIPDRRFDWTAIDERYFDGLPGSIEGRGRTEAEAIADLLEQIEERQA